MANTTTQRVNKLRSTLGLGNQIRSLADLERDYFSSVSGLAVGSINDHKKRFFSVVKGFSGSLSDVELAYYKSKGAVGTNAADITMDFYTNRLLG
jgi:hypothetical protein